MARPLWRGTLGFGLVSIPVEMHTAVRDPGPHFHFLRRSDKSRISYQKVGGNDAEEVSKDELVKGYEYQKGRYVVLTQEDFESAAVERNSRIDVLDFVDGQEIDDRYFDKPYYLLPGKGGAASEPWPGAWQRANHRAPGQGKAIEARRENLIYRSSSRPRSTRAFSC